MPNYKINFELIDWKSPIKGVRSKTYQDNHKKLRLVEYTKDMPHHWCSKGHYGLILEGEFEIEFSNKKIIYKKGDGVFIPSGEKHKHKGRSITDVVKVIFVENL